MHLNELIIIQPLALSDEETWSYNERDMESGPISCPIYHLLDRKVVSDTV